MKKTFTILLLCIGIFCLTGCSLGRLFEDQEEKYYKDERYFDLDSLDTMNSDIKYAIEKGIEDAMPLKMRNGVFHIENNTFIYNSEEDKTKIKVKFEKFLINATPTENDSELFFIGTITKEYENKIEGATYTIVSQSTTEMSF